MKITPDVQKLLNISKDRMERKDPEEFKKIMEKALTAEEEKKLMEACKEFESIFVNMMLKSMRGTVQQSGLLQKSFEREIFESMYDEKLSEEIVKGQGVGIAKMLFNQLKNR